MSEGSQVLTDKQLSYGDFSFREIEAPKKVTWEPLSRSYPVAKKHASYLRLAMYPEHYDAIVQRVKEGLAGVEFDAFVSSGLSGVLIAPIVAHAMGKELIVVRKEDDKANHSGFSVEGQPFWCCRYVILDDLVGCGSTVQRIVRQMAIAERDSNDIEKRTNIRFTPVGVALYLCGNNYVNIWRDGVPEDSWIHNLPAGEDLDIAIKLPCYDCSGSIRDVEQYHFNFMNEL